MKVMKNMPQNGCQHERMNQGVKSKGF